MVTRLLRVDQREQVHEAATPYLGFYGFYNRAWMAYSAPVVTRYKVAVMESKLWSADGQRLLWSALTESSDPDDLERTTRDFAKVVGEALARQGLIPAGP